jgi:cell division protein ZapA
MEERLVSFTLFGQEFSFYSDAPDDEVEGAIALLREELEGTDLAARSTIPSSTMLVLGCLQLAARCVRLEKDFGRYRTDHEQTLGKIIDKISTVDGSS